MSRAAGALAVAVVTAALAWQLTAAPRAQAAQASAEREVTFRLIVVSSEAAARDVARRLQRGADADALAAAESNDPSAARGGLIGPVVLSELRAELRDALAALTPGATSDVIRLPTGFGIAQLAEPTANRRRLRSTEIGGLAATGAVQPTVSVDGFAEANTILQEAPKANDDWNLYPRQICEVRRSSMAEMIQSMTELTASMKAPNASPAPDPVDVIQADVILGQIHAYDGRMAETIARFEQAYPGATKNFPEALAQLEEMLGVAHLHKAEMDNGAYRTPGDRCLLSPKPRALADARGARTAIDYFGKALARKPGDGELTWLLNLAHMAAGSYPAGVPAGALIPPSAFASDDDIGRFTDVAPALGLDSFSSAGGVIVDDFDNDGSLEILTSNFDSCGAMQLFRRGPDGRFHDQAARAGLTNELGGLNLLQADYDNDGCRDVLVLRGGWELAQRKSLLRNNCDGTFSDVTVASGLATPVTSTQTAVWTDVDNDGLIDLFVGNEDRPAQLFRNRGDGTFADVAGKAGVDRTAFTKGVAAADVDNDGFPDLYASNLGGGNFFHQNNRNGTFTERAAEAGVPGAERGFPTWFFDYDNDGLDDLLVSSYFLSVDETARSYLGQTSNASTMKLYRNLGGARFEDVTARANLSKVFMPMGSNFGDIDNDGFLDIYLGTGSPSYGALVPSVLLRNRGGAAFVDVTVSSGTGEWHKGHGVAFADLDGDGDQEIVFKVGGATPGDAHAFRLFDNPGGGGDWLGIHLTGVKTNRAAIGARITVTVENGGRRREIHRTVSSGGSFGASPLQQHVGLGADARITEVEIWWPVSNTRQRFANVAKNQVIEVRELAEGYQTRPRAVAPLGGPSRAR